MAFTWKSYSLAQPNRNLKCTYRLKKVICVGLVLKRWYCRQFESACEYANPPKGSTWQSFSLRSATCKHHNMLSNLMWVPLKGEMEQGEGAHTTHHTHSQLHTPTGLPSPPHSIPHTPHAVPLAHPLIQQVPRWPRVCFPGNQAGGREERSTDHLSLFICLGFSHHVGD